jgi:hypothetical protein
MEYFNDTIAAKLITTNSQTVLRENAIAVINFNLERIKQDRHHIQNMAFVRV